MTHPRTVLRHAIADRLAGPRADGTFWTAAGSRVFRGRGQAPADPGELPALVVQSGREDIAEASYPMDGENGHLRRTYTVIVDCLVAPGPTDQDALDELAEGVEAALEWLVVPGMESATIRPLRCDRPIDGEGSVACALGRLWVQVRYYAPYRTHPADAPYAPRLFVSPFPAVGAAHEAEYEELLP